MLMADFLLVSCGSKSLTPNQQRYATIELECLAVYFAVDKCSYYLKGGTHFTVATDHKPLEGIFAEDLYDIPSFVWTAVPNSEENLPSSAKISA